jgi:hypothetical protein
MVCVEARLTAAHGQKRTCGIAEGRLDRIVWQPVIDSRRFCDERTCRPGPQARFGRMPGDDAFSGGAAERPTTAAATRGTTVSGRAAERRATGRADAGQQTGWTAESGRKQAWSAGRRRHAYTEQPATTEQSATAEQSATTEQQATTEQSATTEQQAAAEQSARAEASAVGTAAGEPAFV